MRRAVHEQISAVFGGQFPGMGQGKGTAVDRRRAASRVGHGELKMSRVRAAFFPSHTEADIALFRRPHRVREQRRQHTGKAFPVAPVTQGDMRSDIP